MKSYKDLGKIAGVLFLDNLIPYVIAQMIILDGLFYVPDYLEVLSSNRTRIGIAVLLQFISIIAMLAFAVHMYSILRKFGNKLSLGYLGLRFVEFGIIVYSIIKQLSLFEYSQLVKDIKFNELPLSQLLADSMLQELQWIGVMYMLVYVIHCVIFYHLLFKSNLVPKIISIGGLIVTFVAFTNIINHLFNLNFGGFFLFAPSGIVELILAFWLLLKGFKKVSAN